MKNILIMGKGVYVKYKEIVNYVIAGGVTTLVSLGTYYLLTNLLLNPKDIFQLQIANVVSWMVSVATAYIINRIFVFRSENSNIFKEICMFYIARIGTLIIDMLSMFILVNIIGINDKISKIIVQFIIMILNYVFSKFLIFKKVKISKKFAK